MDTNQQQPAQPTPPADKPKGVYAGEKIIKRLDLPTPGTYVLLLTNPKMAELKDPVSGKMFTQGEQMLTKVILEWNFADKNGNILEINTKNLEENLSAFDQIAMTKFLKFDQIMSMEKKTS